MPDDTLRPASDTRALQQEGLGIAGVYVLSFLWVHLTAGDHLVSVKITALFLAGLIAVPIAVGLPLVMMRRALAPADGDPSPLAAIAPFARPALFGLQAVLVYLATTHAYRWLLGL